MLAHLAGKVEERKVLHPVVVVHHQGRILILALEVQELGHLCLDALLVVAQRLVVQQVALLRLAAGVANHACGTADQNDGPVAAALQVA